MTTPPRVAAALCGLVAIGLVATWAGGSGAASTEDGHRLYQAHCAACHGARLEGQPDWRRPGPAGRMPAPPHDETGHSWHHPDRVLREIILRGSAEVVGQGYESDMPGFEGRLDADEVEAILGFLKSRWPERERAFQADVTAVDQKGR